MRQGQRTKDAGLSQFRRSPPPSCQLTLTGRVVESGWLSCPLTFGSTGAAQSPVTSPRLKGGNSPDSLSRRLNLSLSGWSSWSGCLGQVLTPDAWIGAQSSGHLLQKTPLTHISQWSEAVRRRHKVAHHCSISHGGYHTGTAGLKPEKPSLQTTNVQCPGVVPPRHPPSPIHQRTALQHPLEALKGKSTRRMCWVGEEGAHLEVTRAWELSPAYGHFRPRPWPFVSIASPDSKQWVSFGTYPSIETVLFFFHQCCSTMHSTMLISVFNQSDGIERQMKEAEEMPSNLVFVSGVS